MLRKNRFLSVALAKMNKFFCKSVPPVAEEGLVLGRKVRWGSLTKALLYQLSYVGAKPGRTQNY
jgi:hypothetical protein